MKKMKTDSEAFLTDEKDISRLSEILLTIKKEYSSWVQSRQVASWSALLFYFPLLWYFNKLIFNENCSPIFNSLFTHIIILFVPVILWYIFFRFIHANYQQIFFTYSRNSVINKASIEIIHKKVEFFKNNKIADAEGLLNYITNTAKNKFNATYNKKRGKFQPVKIVIALWLGLLINNDKYKNLTNVERQEAALFFLLFFSTLFYEIYLLKILKIFEFLIGLCNKAIDCLFHN